MLMISLCVILKFVVAESQIHTQKYGRRPYGVGLLVAGYDVSGSWDLQSVCDRTVNSVVVRICSKHRPRVITTATKRTRLARDLSRPKRT
jgi:hypothetical protein